MSLPLPLEPGHVYRTREFIEFDSNPTRWAKQFTEKGVLRRAAQGLYYLPKQTRWGPAAATEQALLCAFLGDDHFVITGSEAWNPLGLGMTGLLMVTLVYNPHRSGEFVLDGRRFWLRRVRFPSPTPLEWFVVDAFENHEMVGADPMAMLEAFKQRLREGRFDRSILKEMLQKYASPKIREFLGGVLSKEVLS